jgi:hypothetical protein
MIQLQVEGAADKDGRAPSIWDTFAHSGMLFFLLLFISFHKLYVRGSTHLVVGLFFFFFFSQTHCVFIFIFIFIYKRIIYRQYKK